MKTIADVLVAVVAVEHVWFLVLEMFLWTKPLGLRTFSHTLEEAIKMAPLAANQGLYNGFLAAGLLWGVSLGAAGFSIKIFFLLCVIIACATCDQRGNRFAKARARPTRTDRFRRHHTHSGGDSLHRLRRWRGCAGVSPPMTVDPWCRSAFPEARRRWAEICPSSYAAQ